MLRVLIVMALVFGASGCQSQAVKPPAEAAMPAQPVEDPHAPLIEKLDAGSEELSDLAQKLLLVQEQVIKLNQNVQALDQRALQQLKAMQRIQMLQAAAAPAKSESETAPEGPSPIDQLTELVFRLEQISGDQAQASSAQPDAAAIALPGFRMVSAYTPAGTWVVLKYDEATGLTWQAEKGSWREVEEVRIPGTSSYQVVLQPASGDKKGYVAARIDRATGQTWWLNDNRWEAFQ